MKYTEINLWYYGIMILGQLSNCRDNETRFFTICLDFLLFQLLLTI